MSFSTVSPIAELQSRVGISAGIAKALLKQCSPPGKIGAAIKLAVDWGVLDEHKAMVARLKLHHNLSTEVAERLIAVTGLDGDVCKIVKALLATYHAKHSTLVPTAKPFRPLWETSTLVPTAAPFFPRQLSRSASHSTLSAEAAIFVPSADIDLPQWLDFDMPQWLDDPVLEKAWLKIQAVW